MKPRLLLALLNAIALMLGVVWDTAADTDGMRQHVRCPIDGEMLHADAQAASAPSQIESADPSDHGHGCELAKMGNPPQPIRFGPALSLQAPVHVEDTAVAHDTSVAAPRVAVLAYAPKLSPPLA